MPSPHTLRKRFAEQDERDITVAVEALLQHKHGRKFLWWLLEIGAIGRQPFTANALSTSFACGELNVGQQILERIIVTSPDGYVGMLKEQQNDRAERDAALRAAERPTEPGDDATDDADA